MPQKLERKSANRVAHLSCNGAGLEHGVELLPEQRGVVVQGSQDNIQLVNLKISHVDPDQFDLRKIPIFKKLFSHTNSTPEKGLICFV